jgi:acyl dehydratase
MFAPPTFLSSCSNGGWRAGDEARPSIDDILVEYSGAWIRDSWRWEQPAWVGTRVQAEGTLDAVVPHTSRSRRDALLEDERTTYRDAGTGAVLAENTRRFLRFRRREGDEIIAVPAPPPARYDAAERARIAQQYASEPAARRGADPRYHEDVRVGDALTTLVKGPLTVTNIVGWVLGWGSPMTHTNRIEDQFFRASPSSFWLDEDSGIRDTLEGAHWNDRFARVNGFPGPYDFGAQRVAWIAHALTDWMGDAGFLRSLAVDLRRPNIVGDTTWIGGRVTAVPGDGTGAVTCALDAVNQRGEISARAEAVVELLSRASS